MNEALIKWVIESASLFHSLYDILLDAIENAGLSLRRFANTRWLFIAKLIKYLLDNRLSLFAVLTKYEYEIISEEKTAVLEEMNLLLMAYDDVVEELLTVSFIPLSFYIPVFTVLKSKISKCVVPHTSAMKADLLKNLTVDSWESNLIVATALNPRFHKGIFADYPMDKVKSYLESIRTFF